MAESQTLNGRDVDAITAPNDLRNGKGVGDTDADTVVDLTNPHPGDRLTPPYSSAARESSAVVATFNLVATIVGAAILSLPLAFAKCGVPVAASLSVVAAYVTDRSVWMLCLSARRTGATSYGEVVRCAFGPAAEQAVSGIMFVFLMFVIVGFMVLLRDIWTPLAVSAFGATGEEHGDAVGDLVLLGILVLLSPFIVQRTLHALRFNCYVGFVSVTVLCAALCRGGWSNAADLLRGDGDGDGDNSDVEDIDIEIEIVNDRPTYEDMYRIPPVEDVLFALPIIMLSFMCHYNVVAVQGALVRPSRRRIKRVASTAILASFALSLTFALGGYLYAGDAVYGNVLLNVSENGERGWLFVLGRIGYGTTLMLAMPLLVLPCRESILEVLDVWYHQFRHGRHRRRAESEGGIGIGSDGDNGNCAAAGIIITADEEGGADANGIEDKDINDIDDDDDLSSVFEIPADLPCERTPLMDPSTPGRKSFHRILSRQHTIREDRLFLKPAVHYLSTFLIFSSCYVCAVRVDGIAIIWSLCGSSMAFLLAFIFPSACFIRIEFGENDYQGNLVALAWVLLVSAIAGAIVCTYSTVMTHM